MYEDPLHFLYTEGFWFSKVNTKNIECVVIAHLVIWTSTAESTVIVNLSSPLLGNGL